MNVSGSLSTHDSARGLSRGRRSGLLSMSHAELSARETFPFLDVSASRFVEAALFFPPHGGGSCFLLPPPPPPRHLQRRRSEFRRLRAPCPKYLRDGGHLWSPWPSSWPSYPAPCRAPEPASLSKAGWLVPRAAEPDTESAPPSLSSPEKTNREA